MIWINTDRPEISRDRGESPRTVIGAEEIVLPDRAPPPPPTSPSPRRFRWLRRFAWLAVFMIVLLLVLIASIQAVLWSDFPRRYVLGQLERQLGLRVEAHTLQTTWRGHTSLQDVALSLPLGEEAFVRVPRMEIRHTALIPLLLRWPLEVKSLSLEAPALVVKQDRTGQWDILEVADLLTRIGGGQQAQAATDARQKKSPTTLLPEITLADGTLRMLPWQGEPVQIQGIQLQGRPSGRLAWLYEAQLGQTSGAFARVKGEVAPGGRWKHLLRADARDIRPWIAPFAPWWPESAAGGLAWEGSFENNTLSGLLEIESLEALDMKVVGAVEVRAAARRASLQPRTLTLTTPHPLFSRVQVIGGTIDASPEVLKIDALSLRTLGGALSISGRYAPAPGDASAQIAWEDLQPVPSTRLTGSATVTLAGAGPLAVDNPTRSLEVDLHGRAETPAGLLDATGQLHARGKNWNQLDWNAQFGRTAWSGWPPVELAQVSAQGTVSPTTITLASLSARGPGTITGTGEWNYIDRTWYTILRAEALPIPKTQNTAHLALDARGDRENVHLQQATVRAAGITAHAAGTYTYTLPKPLDLAVELRETTFGQPVLPATLADSATAASRPASPAPTPVAPPSIAQADRTLRIQGKVRGNARLNGTLAPLEIDIQGRLHTLGLSLLNRDRSRDFGDAEVQVTGNLNDRRVHLETTEMDALRGRWKWSADYPFATRMASVHVAVDDLPLAEVADALRLHLPVEGGVGRTTPMLGGLATGTMTLESPGFDLAGVRGDGALRIANPQVKIPAAGTPTLAAESAFARILIDDGRIELIPEARQAVAGGTAPEPAHGPGGTLRGSIITDVRDLERLTTQLHLDNWIVGYAGEEGLARLSASLQGDFDVREISGTAQARTRALFWYRGRQIGDVEADASLAGRVLSISPARASLLDGQFHGTARLNLDALEAATLSLSWQNLDAQGLAEFHPWLKGAAGTYSGSILMAPDQDPRALEPLKLVATLTNQGGSYRGIQIGSGRAEAYASSARLILNRSSIEVARGRLTFWGRSVQRDGRWTTNQLRIAADKLDLNELVQAVRPGSDEMVGLISGEIDALGNPRRPEALSGGGVLTIQNSDLVNSDIIAGIYTLMNIGTAGRQADGHGKMIFRFEQGNAHITEMNYFNRGVQIYGTGRVNNVLDLPDSPLDLVAAGTARPLRNVKLPLLAEIDEILGVLQTQVTTVRATGTLAEPTVLPVLLEEAGRDLGAILSGQVHSR